MNTIAIDVDEVLSNSYDLMIDVGVAQGHTFRPGHQYHPRHWFGLEGEDLRALQDVIDVELEHAQPVSGAPEIVAALAQRFELIALTGRSRAKHGEVTRRFLDKHYPGIFTTIVFADQEGENLSKGELAIRAGASALIDDLPVYVLDCADAGVPVVYLNRSMPWQHDVDHPLVYTAPDWSQVPWALTASLALVEDLLALA